jgi:hypothetical protein
MPNRALPCLLVLLLASLAAARPARADGWEETRETFRAAMKSEEWKERQDAYLYLSGYDRPEAVEEIRRALDKETNAAVELAAVDALAAQKSQGSREILFQVARKGKGRERLLVLNALARQKSLDVGALLLEVAAGRDGPAAAQAALGLKDQKHPDTVQVLLPLLKHKSWQVRRAAAITLREFRPDEAVKPLADALALSTGRDRNEIIAALFEITGEKFGNDPAAWKALARGTPPEEIRARPTHPPYAFGVPIYGQRVVVCLDNSLRMTDRHPFDDERLRALSTAPDGKAIPWIRVATNGQFAHAQVKHLIRGFTKGTKFELILFNEMVRPVFGGLANVGTASRNTVFEALDGLEPDNGIAAYTALEQALDIAGPGDARAWKSGPDEIIYITVNMPTAGEVVEADLVAAAIGLKARLRMVPIHTVGIHFHPYEMCRQIAALTGGVYVELTK